MKKTLALLLTLVMVLGMATVSSFAATDYTAFNLVFSEKDGANVNDTDIRIFASVDDGTLIDRTNVFTMEDKEWYKYKSAPEPGKTAEDYDYVDEELQIYGTLCDDSDVFDHKNYKYFVRIGVLRTDDEEDYFYRNVKINGVDIDEMNGTCYNAGSYFSIKTVTNGISGYEASSWAQDYIADADEMGLLPDCLEDVDLTQKITRQEFAALAVKVYEKMSGNTDTAPGAAFADCTDEEVLKAVAIGITNGTNVAKNLFSPNANITREQCAAMLARAYKATAFDGWTLATDADFNAQFKACFTMPAKFADDNKISAYAKDSVYFMVANNIISGVGNNTFAPVADTTKGAAYGMATREAAVKIAVEMVNNL